jgi:hypothetical protein
MRFALVILAIALLLAAGTASGRWANPALVPEEQKNNPPPGTYWDEELGVFIFEVPMVVVPPMGAALNQEDPMIYFDDGTALMFAPAMEDYFALTKMPTPECGGDGFLLTSVWLACWNPENYSGEGEVHIFKHETSTEECDDLANNPYSDKIGMEYGWREYVAEPFGEGEIAWTVVHFDDVPGSPVIVTEPDFWVAWDNRATGAVYTFGDFRPDMDPSVCEFRFFESVEDVCPVLMFNWPPWMIRVTGHCIGEPSGSPIDIKPTSCPNPFGVKDKGVIPVAILGTEELEVSEIEPASILLEGVAPLRWAFEDVAEPFPGELCDCWTNGADGKMDLTVKFDAPELLAALDAKYGPLSDGQELTLKLEWDLFDFTPMYGYDCMIIRDKGKGPQSVVDRSQEATFALFQNNPNPFRDETSISFSLAEESRATLTVHDVTGRIVSVVADGEFTAGSHTVEWNADVPAGVYFCRIEAGENNAGRRMVVLR